MLGPSPASLHQKGFWKLEGWNCQDPQKHSPCCKAPESHLGYGEKGKGDLAVVPKYLKGELKRGERFLQSSRQKHKQFQCLEAKAR